MDKSVIIIAFVLAVFDVHAQNIKWEKLPIPATSSLRGISAVSKSACWVSGSDGVIAKTLNCGKTWKVYKIPGAEHLDFRDIHAFDAENVIVMSAGEGELSNLYKTSDGGNTWRLVYKNTYEKGFFNAFAFRNEKNGLLVGDPVKRKLFLLQTTDGGETWTRLKVLPAALKGEYGFAASGSNIFLHPSGACSVATGGKAARVFSSDSTHGAWRAVATPITQGKPSQGIFSLSFRDSLSGVAVGGDYAEETLVGNNIVMTEDGGRRWEALGDHNLSYRSSVVYTDKFIVVAGPTGSDVSFDNGYSWQPLNGGGFHSLSLTEDGFVLWGSGKDGKVGRILLR